MEGTNNNHDYHHSYLETLKSLKSQNKLHGEELDMKCKGQEKIYRDFSAVLNKQDWERCLNNFEELNNNSKEIRQMMKTQNEIAQETFSLTENILESLENSSKNNQILRYSDWVATLIDVVIVPKLGVDAWYKISNVFTRNINQNNEDYYEFEFYENEFELFDQLEEILDKAKITPDDFVCLIRLNKMRNAEFHTNVNSQRLDEAKKQLNMSFPSNLECFKKPLKKALEAIETEWNQPKKRKSRSYRRN